MAIHSEEDNVKTATPAPGPQAPSPQERMQAPGYTSNSGNNPFFNIMSELGSGRSLGPAAEEYLKTIETYLINKNGLTANKIEAYRLIEPAGAHAFVMGKTALVLLFSDVLPNDTHYFGPQSQYARKAYDTLKNKIGEGFKLLNAIIVQPGDYPRASQMAQHIKDILTVANNPNMHDLTINEIRGSRYTIDPDINAVRNYINGMNPSSVAPRADIGFMIKAKKRRDGNYPNQPDELVDVAAVSGYTEILLSQDATGNSKFLPVVHITGIWSTAPVPGIVPLCVTIAADQFISTGRWTQQFTTFQKGKPNLGQLTVDPKDHSKLGFNSNIREVDEWRRQYSLPAILAIDVIEGQARIPAISAYANEVERDVVYKQLQNFFGSSLRIDHQAPAFFIREKAYMGVYGDAAGSQIDSRNFDYVTMVSGGSQDPSMQSLLGYSQDPSARAKLIYEKTGGSFKSLYHLSVSQLNPQLLQVLAQAVQSTLGIEAPPGQNRMTNTDWMGTTSQQYGQANFAVTTLPGSTGIFGNGGFYSV